jgi:FkbM family methyltransferase
MPSLAYHIQGLVRAAGLAKASAILLRRAFGLGGVVSVNVQGHGLVEVRPADSDLFVLSQIFGWEEYKIDVDRLANLRKVASAWQAAGITPMIIDAGSNVGYSAIYFAGLFPGSCVLAIEPDQRSFNILARHAKGNSSIKPINVAIWSHNYGLELKQSSYGSWASQVKEGSGTASERLDVLVASIPNARPLIIKLDIEGAEREVIESCPDIFANAKCIMVEPHDFQNPNGACLFPLYKVAADRKFDTILNGENLLLFAAD